MLWAFSWGLLALCVGLIGVRTSPDTGHVPHGLVVVIVAGAGTVVGFFSGVLYTFLSRISPTGRNRVVLGALAGASGIVGLLGIGAISNSSMANPLMSNLAQVALPALIGASVAALFGALLAALDSKLWPHIENAGGKLDTADSFPRPR
jgi:hypothetical protein